MLTRRFAFWIGLAYIVAGAAGFVPPLMGPVPADAPPVNVTAFYGTALGLFPANFLHHLVHLAVGAWGVSASRTAGGARAFARILAVFYGALAVMGLIPGLNTMFGLVPLYGHDVWLHAGTAILAAFFGWSHVAQTTAGPAKPVES